MCELKTVVEDQKEITGWKIVAEKDGKNYSLAMGFCYDDYDYVPIVKKQERLVHHFNDCILDETGGFGFRKDMVGRTAIYLDETDCYFLLGDIKFGSVDPDYEIKMKKAKVSVDLMIGTYGAEENGEKVVAGRKIEFLEE